MHGLKRGGRTRLDTCNFFILTGTGIEVGMEEDYSVHLFLFFSNTGSGIF